jgi:hypothetical protein
MPDESETMTPEEAAAVARARVAVEQIRAMVGTLIQALEVAEKALSEVWREGAEPQNHRVYQAREEISAALTLTHSREN